MRKITVFNQSGQILKISELDSTNNSEIREHVGTMFGGYRDVTEIFIGTDYIKVWVK